MDNEEKKKKIKVLMTRLGTGVGKIPPPAVCARQMALAVRHFLYARSQRTIVGKASGKRDFKPSDGPAYVD